MTTYEIKDEIASSLSPEAKAWWNGADHEIINEYVIMAQRQGVEAAVKDIEETARS